MCICNELRQNRFCKNRTGTEYGIEWTELAESGTIINFAFPQI